MAFQLMDDLLDYCGDNEQLGKNIGDDLREGKITLPLIHLLEHADRQTAEQVHKALDSRSEALIAEVVSALQQSNSIDYVLKQAEHYCAEGIAGLNGLPNSPYREAMQQLAAVVRKRFDRAASAA